MSALAGQKVVVIGGTSGIGLAIASAALDVGASVVVASRSQEKLGRARAELGEGVEARQLDVTDHHVLARFFGEIGRLHHLAVTAVAGASGPFLELDPGAVRRAVDTKLWGQFWAARYAAPHIAENGSITLFSGLAAWKPIPGGAVTATINGAVAGLARTLALELAPIRVNVVSPGIIDTPLWAGMPEERRSQFFAAHAERLPGKRVGTPEEVALAVLYLMGNGFSTGEVVHVDGGARFV